MRNVKKMKWIAVMTAMMLVFSLLAACGPAESGTNTNNPSGNNSQAPNSQAPETPESQTPEEPQDANSYHFYGETLVQQAIGDSYRCGDLKLNEDGTAVFTMLSREVDSDEKTVLHVWNEGTWTKNDDGSVSITLEVLPEGGGHNETDTGEHIVETQTSLEEGELLAELNSDGKLTVEISVETDLITYSIQQYTEFELVAD